MDEAAKTSRGEKSNAGQKNAPKKEEDVQQQAATNTGAKPKSFKPKFNTSNVTESAPPTTKTEKFVRVPMCLQRILNGVQTEFMENLPEDQKSKYRFITMVQNYQGKMVPKEEHLQEVPKMLRGVECVNDFKENVRKTVNTSLLNSLELDTMSTSNAADLSTRREIYNETEDYKNKKLEELFEFVDANICDVKKEMEESKKSVQTVRKKISESQAIMNQVNEQMGMKSELVSKLAEATLNLKDVDKRHEQLEASFQQAEKVAKQEEIKNARILKNLEDRKSKSQALTKKLSNAEIQLNHCKEIKQKNTELYKERESQLEEVKKKFEDATNEKEKLDKEICILENAARDDKEEIRRSSLELGHLILQIGSVEELEIKLRDMEEKNKIMEKRAKSFEQHPESLKEFQEEIAQLQQSEAEYVVKTEEMKAEMSAAVTKINDLCKKQSEVETECTNILRAIDDRQRNFSEAQVEYFRRKEEIQALENENEQASILRLNQEEEMRKLEAQLKELKKKKSE